MIRYYICLFFLILPTSCDVPNENLISCNFNDGIMLCFIDNLYEIDEKIYYNQLIYYKGDEHIYFRKLENNFFDYLNGTILDKKLDENYFIEKYNELINNIPTELNNNFLNYPALRKNGYINYININIYANILFFEHIYKKDIVINETVVSDRIEKKDINIININRIKSLFTKLDNEIIEKYKGSILSCPRFI